MCMISIIEVSSFSSFNTEIFQQTYPETNIASITETTHAIFLHDSWTDVIFFVL